MHVWGYYATEYSLYMDRLAKWLHFPMKMEVKIGKDLSVYMIVHTLQCHKYVESILLQNFNDSERLQRGVLMHLMGIFWCSLTKLVLDECNVVLVRESDPTVVVYCVAITAIILCAETHMAKLATHVLGS